MSKATDLLVEYALADMQFQGELTLDDSAWDKNDDLVITDKYFDRMVEIAEMRGRALRAAVDEKLVSKERAEATCEKLEDAMVQQFVNTIFFNA